MLDVVLDELAAAEAAQGGDPAEDEEEPDTAAQVPTGPVRGLLRRPATGRVPAGGAPAPEEAAAPGSGHVEDGLVF